ncbi:MAG: MG2 domain-containing protein [Desulfobacterales bacterium]|nr:MG2 domain-containing protein [Desulfobacterales bacterium]
MRRTLLAALLAAFFCSPLAAQEPPRVLEFAPRGSAKNVRQVKASFSEPMVAFGDPRAASPFSVRCDEPGQGRWVDPRTWVYDFARDLPGGLRCTFTLEAGVRALSGRPVGGARHFAFNTGGPAIRNALPAAGLRGISEDQVFILVLDSVPEEASVLARARFAIAGIAQAVGVEILAGEPRDAILAAHPWLFGQAEERSRCLLLRCRQRFPQKTKVSLIWGKGIQSLSGVATEQDQVLAFETREAFLAEFACERENPRAGCIPLLPMRLRFNAPLESGQTGEAVLKGPAGKSWRAPLGKDGGALTFAGPFPAHADFLLEVPAGVRDDAGRPLANAGRFPLKVRTAGTPPLAKFAARFGIIELNADPVLPVTLRNLEPDPGARMMAVGAGPSGRVNGRIIRLGPGRGGEIQHWLRRVKAARRDSSLLAGEPAAAGFQLPQTLGPGAFEVVGIPLKRPGLHIVEIESAVLGKALLDPPRPMYVPAAALVTNLSVHFKQGRDSSLVWVTTLDTAAPVPAAEVAVMACDGSLLWTGRTDADGIARIEGPLPEAAGAGACADGLPEEDGFQPYDPMVAGQGLFITAHTAEDMSFVHSSWSEGIEAWRFKLPAETGAGPETAHTIFDRSLLRAGETLHMKHLIRRRTMGGFELPAAERLPDAVVIRHAGTRQTYELPLAWDAAGTAESEWAIPKEAKLGSYSVSLVRSTAAAGPPQGAPAAAEDEEEEEGGTEAVAPRRLVSGHFRVEEFRLPLLKGTIQAPSHPLINAREVALDLAVQYLAGGGAGMLPVTLRADVAARRLPAFEEFAEVVFANGTVAEGRVRRGEEAEPGAAAARPPLIATELELGPAGTARAVVPGLPAAGVPQELTVEMEFRDPNGEVQTVSSRVALWNSGRLVGIKMEGWAARKNALDFQVAVVDLSGRPVAGAPVRVELFERRAISHRKRLVGGFYAYDHTVETRRVATLAEGRTDANGWLQCRSASPLSGEVILAAESRDENDRPTFAHRSVWVAGEQQWWFEAADDDRMDLLPERRRYEPGETALFQVRMPFREATALISVEREGVMETRVQRLSGRQPVVEIPVKGNHAPNVFVSVLAVRGRTGAVQPTALADLGKPAFKLGMAEIGVGWRAHELKVSVSSARQVVGVRDKVKVAIRAATAEGVAPPAGAEAALVAVDEGLLELMPNRSWDLLAAMMGRRGCAVRTATAQMQVVGKRHFGAKALPPGGGGGRRATRELFDPLILWRARVPLDAAGRAEVDLALNDSATSFRIVAVVNGGAGLFGTGMTSIRATQELTILPGLPPLVREGDRFRAGVTVRNSSQQPMMLVLSARAAGVMPALPPQRFALAAGEAQERFWEVSAPSGQEQLSWEIEAAAQESAAADRVRVSQKIVPAVPPQVVQAEILQLDGEALQTVEAPADALAGGGVRVAARARIGDGLRAVADYMRRYPYRCTEQKISAAVALRDRALWDQQMAELPAVMDGDGLVKFFPSLPQGDPVLTAYIAAVGHAAGWSIPAEARLRVVHGLTRFVDGSLSRPSPSAAADLTLRKLAALAALARLGAADAALAGSLAVEPDLWPTSAVLDWLDFLLHAENFPARGRQLAQAEQALRARMVTQGTLSALAAGASDRMWWLMASEDVNAVRWVLAALALEGWRQDLPRLVRGALARQRLGRWDLTTANAWGVLAMERFSEALEADAVTGTTQVELAGHARAFEWDAPLKGGSVLIPWPAGRADLQLRHRGGGRPWVSIHAVAAVPLREPLASGFTIRKRLDALDRRAPERWSRGDVVRVSIEIEAQAAAGWVALSDPLPAGATVLGSGLGRDSRLMTRDEARAGQVWPAFEERSHEAFRVYYEQVPAGRWTVAYTLRLNQSGSFHLPPTRVEALYAPEMMGAIPNAIFEVE